MICSGGDACGFKGVLQGQGEAEDTSSGGVGVHPQTPFVELDNGAADVEAHAHTFALGGVEGREQLVEGIVAEIGSDSVFIDIGAKAEARIEREQLTDKEGKLKVKVGDKLRATVASAGREGILLVVQLGKGGVDTQMLELAQQSGVPIEGTVSKAVKAGLEVEIGGVRAFCPASQIDIGFGNALYIRGEGPGLSWDEGLLMNCVSDDQWQIALGESVRPIVFKFLVNDLSWSAGEDYSVASGASVTLQPTF